MCVWEIKKLVFAFRLGTVYGLNGLTLIRLWDFHRRQIFSHD
jgi:hypothetical protein